MTLQHLDPKKHLKDTLAEVARHLPGSNQQAAECGKPGDPAWEEAQLISDSTAPAARVRSRIGRRLRQRAVVSKGRMASTVRMASKGGTE